NRLAADLQSEASTFDSEECRSAPPFRRTATGHAAAIARTHNKSTLQHGWHHRHTFRRAQDFLWNTLIRRRLNLIQNVRRGFQAIFGLSRFRGCFVCSKGACNYKDSHTYDHKAFHQNPLQAKLIFRVPDLADSEQRAMPPLDTDAAYRRTEKDSDHLFFCKHTRHSCIYKQTIIQQNASAAYDQFAAVANETAYQARQQAADALRRARNRAHYVLDEYPLHVIGAVAVAVFAAGALLRIWRSNHE